MKQADVSIIIVSWNTREVLHNCLYSVYGQTGGAGGINFEVIVVDNASTDGSVEMVKSDFQDVILIENCENKGFAAATNQGIAIAAGRYVLLLNSDTVVLNNAIGEVIAVAEANPEAAVVGCRILNPDRSLQISCFMFPSILNLVLSSSYLYKLFPRSRFFGRERMTWWDRNDTREVEVVTGCFMLVRKKAIEQVGVLDERFFMYAEETDWCYRFHKNKWRIFFTPDAQVIHLGGQSSRKIRSQMYLQLRGSILLFFRKHRHLFVYAFACLLIAWFFALRVPYWLVRAVFSSNGRTAYFEKAKTLAKGVGYALAGGRGLLQQDQPMEL
jgi:hypothetical protein